jgi:ATP-dependent Clp protease ATP-binding subunit ClpB
MAIVLTLWRSGTGNNHRKIIAIEEEIKRLREELTALERRGPEPVERGDSLSVDGRRLARTSPHTITPESIAAIVEKATKIPIQRLLATDKSRLLNLEAALSQQVCTLSMKNDFIRLMSVDVSTPDLSI